MRHKALALAARLLEDRFNADVSDGARPTLPCDCGLQAERSERRDKTFMTALGPMRLQRAYYRCVCGKTFFPRDRQLGFEDSTLSRGVRRMVGHVGAMVSFEEGETLLRELAGLEIEAKRVEREAEELGRLIAQDERSVVEPATQAPAPTVYLGMDGTGVPMRVEELEHRKGKQPDGSAKTREAKLCTLWTAESRDEEGLPVRDPGSVSYSAAIETASTSDTAEHMSDFAQRVQRETQRRGFDQAPRRTVLGDGATWIWNIADELAPGAIQIVDRFHAKERISKAALAYGGEAASKPWIDKRYDELDAGRLSRIVHTLKPLASRGSEIHKLLGYLFNNRRRMRYPKFHAMGLCTSSGVVEAGCKVVVGTRLKRAGMHWTLRGANAIMALRCTLLSGRFEDFWERQVRGKAA